MNLLSNSSIKLSVKIQCKNIFWRKQFDNVFPLKESNNIMKDPVTIVAESQSDKSETVNEKSENEEKNNGNHTPV